MDGGLCQAASKAFRREVQWGQTWEKTASTQVSDNPSKTFTECTLAQGLQGHLSSRRSYPGMRSPGGRADHKGPPRCRGSRGDKDIDFACASRGTRSALPPHPPPPLSSQLGWESFPGGSDSTESACYVGDLGSIPGLGRSPGEGNSYPLQYSGLENSMDRGAWQATVHGVAKSRT